MALAHAVPGQIVQLSRAPTSDARRVAFVKTDAFEAVQLVLGPGQEIARHAVPGYATIQCLEGSVILETDKKVELSAGDWLYLDRGEPHSVSAVEAGSLLVTILFD